MATKKLFPEGDFPFVAETFSLAIQHTADGERLTREAEQSRRDRDHAAQNQLLIPTENPP